MHIKGLKHINTACGKQYESALSDQVSLRRCVWQLWLAMQSLTTMYLTYVHTLDIASYVYVYTSTCSRSFPMSSLDANVFLPMIHT